MSALNSGLTKNFSWREVMRSPVAFQRGIDNTPQIQHMAAIVRTARGMERIRSAIGDRAILVHSWYRSPELNRMIGGARDSQHMRGEAVDFTCPAFGSPRAVVTHLASLIATCPPMGAESTGLPLAQFAEALWIDQLILEPTWIHVSFSETPRREILTRRVLAGKVVYLPGIV